MAQEIPAERTLVFGMNTDGSKHYRIPSLITTQNGTLLAVIDKRGNDIGDLPNIISVVAKRSTDNGKTWSEPIVIAQGDKATNKTYGDATIVMDKSTGKLITVFAGDNGLWHSNKNNKMGIYTSESTDDGLTWSEPRSITSQVYKEDWYGAFPASGRAAQLKDGRILFVLAARPTSDWGGALHNYACYSDDSGKTWSISSTPGDTYGDEAKIIELENGNLLMSIRNRNKGYRKFSVSTDRGESWSAPYVNEDILDPACNGDIMRYTFKKKNKSILLHSLPYSSSIRENIGIYTSEDEGKSWKFRKKICNGYSAYSSLTVLPDGSIGALVEEGKWDNDIPGEDGFNIYFVRIPIKWLLTDKN